MRFWRGPSFTYAPLTSKPSTSTAESFWVALLIADSSTFRIVGAIRLLVVIRMLRASPHFLPRIRSTTRRTFCGDTRRYRASALAILTGVAIRLSLPRLLTPPAYFADDDFPALAACPLKVRVGENSPSLCPTMFSVIYTGMNFLPL